MLSSLASSAERRAQRSGVRTKFPVSKIASSRLQSAINEKALGPEHPHTANSLYNLAYFLDNQGKPAEAEPLFRRALAINEKALGPEHPNTVLVRNHLSSFYRKQARNAEADALVKGAKGKAK